ncbi:hypothetical protein ASD54_07535 [Rhizobium sp. Root149]|uniref:hypothetical protein n=1 Tax=Rhizobium sp. Root149 TaxID=1736473 RepID=UPI000713F45D|nr:hypothetical protein [Rhizobium sp. Root149]KQZ55122.1 hypothetical protein ASD54_07535 [Rhizobium sp. Root149]
MSAQYHFDVFGPDFRSLALVHTESGQYDWVDFEVSFFPRSGVVAARVVLREAADSSLYYVNVDGALDIRTEMQEWLKDSGYSISIPCDYRSDDSKSATLREAQAIRDRFLAGDYAPLDAL